MCIRDRDFGGMVFSVSPMNSALDFVHPLANDFEDFLRLLLACSDSAALEPVSYTHLDVYKRQGQGCGDEGVAGYILGIQSPEC